jgi:hypothetical protein
MTVETPRSAPIRTAPAFFANSVLAAAIGVTLARVVEQLTVALVGLATGWEPVLTNTAAVLDGSGPEWVTFSAPVASLVLGSSLLLLYPGAKDRSVGRLTMLWTMLFAFRAGFLGIARDAVDETSVLAGWLADLPEWVPLTLAALSIVSLVGVCVAAAPAFLAFARHRSEVYTRSERVRFASSLVLVPGLVGPLVAVPFFLPDAGTGFVTSLPLAGLFVLAIVAAAPFVRRFREPEVVEDRGVSLGLVAWFLAVFLLVRLGLGAAGVPIPPWDPDMVFTWRP